jgi:hypothetical protein
VADEAKTVESRDDFELLSPDSKPKEVGEEVMNLWRLIVEDKKRLGYHELWTKLYKLIKNFHWQAKSVANIKLASINLTHPHLQRTVNVLTDQNPTFNVKAEGNLQPDQESVLEDQLHQAEHWWNETEQQHKYARAVRTGEIYGITGVESTFNPDLKKGWGEVETHILDPFHFGWYPLELADPHDLQGCDAFLVWVPTSVRKLRRQYPKLAEEIKPDGVIMKDLGDDRREVNAESGKEGGPTMVVSILNTIKTIYSKFGGMNLNDNEDKTLLVKAYVKDYRKDKDGNDKYKGNIRYIEVCSGGKVVLQDKNNPNISPALSDDLGRQTYLWDRFPVALANSVDDTSSAWGESDLSQVEEIVKELDKIASQLIYYKDKAVRMKIINPVSTGVDNAAFTNEGGVINPANSNEAKAIRWLEPPPMNQDLTAYLTLFKDLFFLVAGTFELDQAQGQDNRLAFKSIAALMERAATMMRGKIRNYGYLIREIGRMYISHVQNFYNEGDGATDRWLTYKNNKGQDVSKAIRGINLIIPANLTVVTGSTMPISKIQQREEAIALWERKAIDLEGLHNALETPHREQLIQRMNQGPLGDLFQKLSQIGAPDGLVQGIQQLAELDPKMFDRAKERGQIPPFMQWIQQFIDGQQGQQPPPDPSVQGDLMLKQKQMEKMDADTVINAKKAEAEIALITEKINTEKVDQQRLQAGIALDTAVLKIKRAEAVSGIMTSHRQTEADIQRGHHDDALRDAETATNIAAVHHDAKLKADKTAADIKAGQVTGFKSDNKGEE